MDVINALRDGLSKWSYKPPGASAEAIDRLIATSPIRLPATYLELLRFINGGEGELGIEPGWFVFWSAEDVAQNNLGYNLAEFLPEFFGFGSNGGGELFAFDTRNGEPWSVVMVPFIPLDAKEAITIAPDFETFLWTLGREQSDSET